MFTRILYLLLIFPFLLVLLHTIIRVIRYFHKFPIPEFAVKFIDNPIRRKLQPPRETAIRHEIKSGMHVLEIGPGNGTYTIGAAQQVGLTGKIITIDIQPKLIEKLNKRIEIEGIQNIEARVANVYDLPFDDSNFDLITMITVINEIPDIPQALRECHRVLKPNGKLVTSEIFVDPDYPLARNLIRTIETGNFRLIRRKGNFFYYTLIFQKT